MSIRIDKSTKQQLIFFSMILMLISLFTSRFLLSIGFILFLVFTCFHNNIIQQLVSFLKNPFLVGMSLLFFIPFVSWFWTEDKSMWLRFARIKLPLFLFPVAFAGNWQLTSKQWRWTAYCFLILVFAGCSWSLLQYAKNFHSINEQYLQAKLLATPLENDHVRFSLVVAVAVATIVLLLLEYLPKRNWLLTSIAAIFFIVYLHILSARTGLICLYFLLFTILFYLLFKLKKKKWIIVIFILLIAMPLAAWFLFPTFQNRIHYNRYDISNALENKYVVGSSDGNRIVSLKAAWSVLQQHPFGVGGDLIAKTHEWYDQNVPQMPERDKLFPSSEPLMYAGFAGWIGLILFCAAMLLPFFERVKKNYFFWFILNFMMAFSFLFDIGLEAQFGVFVYAFTVLWWWKWFHISPTNKPLAS